MTSRKKSSGSLPGAGPGLAIPASAPPAPRRAGTPVPVENVTTATFKCVFPVCGGICCKNGRPGLETYQAEKIEANLGKFLPHLRPTARKHVEKHGWLTHRTKEAPVAPATKEDHVSAAQPAVCGYASPETTMHPKANARKR